MVISSRKYQLYKRGLKNPDYIGKFEELSDDWQIIKNRFNCGDIMKSNSSNRQDWKKHYTDPNITAMVMNRYKDDISMLGYQDICNSLVDVQT
jgi:hypothetical protein